MHLIKISFVALTAFTVIAPMSSRADVVINEVFYHAPDDLHDLQWIELHNSGDRAVDLAGWKLAKGVEYTFTGSVISPGGYVVVCKNRTRFEEFYDAKVAGEHKKSLKLSGDELELRDAAGETVDRVSFSDDSPWSRAADGESASLERICPGAAGNLAENWGASSWSGDGKTPAGTPGQQNSIFASSLPPIISAVTAAPARIAPAEQLRIQATVQDSQTLREVNLCYVVVGAGLESSEVVVPMTADGDQKYSATIPGQKSGAVIRFRIQAGNERGARRHFPAQNEPQPALSVFVHEPINPGKIPVGFFVNGDREQLPSLSTQTRASTANRPDPFPGGGRMRAERQIRSGLDLSSIWASLTLTSKEPRGLEALRVEFVRLEAERSRLLNATLQSIGKDGEGAEAQKVVKTFKESVRDAVKQLVDEDGVKALEAWSAQGGDGGGFGGGRSPAAALRSFLPFEPAYLYLSTTCNPTQFIAVRDIYKEAARNRDGLAEEVAQLMGPPRADGSDAREEFEAKVQALETGVTQKLRSVLRSQQVRDLANWRAGQPDGFGRRKAQKQLPGKSTFVFVDVRTKEPKLFDFVQITERSGGYKVRLGKGQQLEGHGVLNIVAGPDRRQLIAEPLAYELHRNVGSPVYLSDYVRLSIDGQSLGYHYLFGQPNSRLLTKLGFKDDGNLYKAYWVGRGLTGKHVKKTNPHTGHDDLVELVAELQRTKVAPTSQWELIKREFAVEPLVNHYAVRLLISDWDGFFNNFYLYHDTGKTKKWYFLPWDEDKTWGAYDGMGGGKLLIDMATTFGAEGDRPPGGGGGAGFGGGGWRAGGYISRPVLANPTFKSLYLARVKQLLGTEFTETKLFPLIDQYRDRLREEVEFRASVSKEDPVVALERFEQDLASLKEFVEKRREWLLAREEIRSAAQYDKKLRDLSHADEGSEPSNSGGF